MADANELNNAIEACEKAIGFIAKRELDISTLETQLNDGIDFHCLAVWQIRYALGIAFSAGMAYHSGRMDEILSRQRKK